jgi:hypothetical protein
MPIHTCLWHDLEDTVKRAEKVGEEVVQVVDAPNRVVVITKKKPGRPPKVETRA